MHQDCNICLVSQFLSKGIIKHLFIDAEFVEDHKHAGL